MDYASARALLSAHCDDRPVSVYRRPIERQMCGGRDCQVVRVGGRLAVSWQQRGRRLAVVGAGELADVEQLMAKRGGG